MESVKQSIENLEEAEDLVISLLELASRIVSELKEIQSSSEKKESLIQNLNQYYESLIKVKDILNSEIKLSEGQTYQSSSNFSRKGVDRLAIASWEAEVIANNIRDINNS